MTSVHDRLLHIWRAAAESGRPLPSEVALASSLGVSRPKLREELVRLEYEGLVTRIPNSGTYPNRSALAMGIRLDQSYEFSEMIEAAGFAAAIEVLDTRWCEIDPARAAALGVQPGSEAFETTKRWSAGGQFVMVAVDLIPASRGNGVEPDPLSTVFELVSELRGASVEWETSSICGRLADDRETELLSLTGHESVLELSTLGLSVLGIPLYHAREIHRQGIVPYGLTRTVPRPSTD